MIRTISRSAYMCTTTLFFGYLGSEAGESFDKACKETLQCVQSASPHTAEKIATLCGAYVGFIGGCAILAADLFIERHKTTQSLSREKF